MKIAKMNSLPDEAKNPSVVKPQTRYPGPIEWALNLLHKYQILNFMLVGGIGYVVNMLTYWPLTLVFENQVTFLGQQFYLPPFVISSLIAIFCNYELNRLWTFKGWQERSLGGARYLIMALGTLLIDMGFLFLLVQYGGLPPIPAAAIAILIVFVIRFLIARNWVWAK
jgi:putative flippase GtrA